MGRPVCSTARFLPTRCLLSVTSSRADRQRVTVVDHDCGPDRLPFSQLVVSVVEVTEFASEDDPISGPSQLVGSPAGTAAEEVSCDGSGVAQVALR